jgi:hypothetical protein
MANINVSAQSGFVQLYLSTTTNVNTSSVITSTSTGVLLVPALQDVTVTNNNGVFRWKQLDELGQKVAVTPATNSVNLTLVLDDTAFYGSTGALPQTGATAVQSGMFNLSNEKTRVYFKLYWGGTGNTEAVYGSAFLSGLAPKVTPDQPVWISPLILEVDGRYTVSAT